MSAAQTRTFQLASLLGAGFYCAECAERVCTATSRLPGVLESRCEAEMGTLSVAFDAEIVAPDDLEAALVRLVAEETAGATHATYRVTGLD